MVLRLSMDVAAKSSMAANRQGFSHAAGIIVDFTWC